ncbi:protein FLOWERING LOCUS D [Apium graveolens]|uniref:protein FLOWERING LOCUS D n=1 Tax=Apium graveolens TaxID=4045 RepID=UPI003D7BABDA
MNPSSSSNQNPQNQNPLQFSILNPQSNPNPNPNPNFTPNSIESQNDPDYYPSSISNPNLTNYISLSIPKKRRRGRSRTASTPSHNQVYQIPNLISSGNNVISTNNGGVFGNTGNGVVDDEIIVINKDATNEALVALTSGFPADSLTSEEIDGGVVSVVGGIEQVNYILIRNHIITRWREDVFSWITKEMFVDVIPKHCRGLLDKAYEYLLSRGFINFGVAPAIKERILGEVSKSNVIIIGAGLAGLAAARQLMSFGYKVTVLEGRKRAGGRVYTKKMDGASKTAAADLGGSVLTGTLGNPLGILAKQLSYPLHKVRDKCPLYKVDGKPVDPDLDTKVEIAYNQLLDKASNLRQLMGEVSQDVSLGAALESFWPVDGIVGNEEATKLFNWHIANLEYANAGLVSKLSLAFWDQDDPFDMGGDHCFLPGGNGRLVQALSENVPIQYEKIVHTIRYGGHGVQVISGGQIYEGDMALCTVPLGVLKSGSIKFIPELPQRKLEGIKRLGFGLLNKVAMLFPYVFWGTDLDTFGHLTDDQSSRGEFFLFYSYATVAGGPLLIALVAGEAAHKFESMPPTDAVTQVLQILKGIYQPKGIDVPDPIQTVCTRWGSDPFSLGSYSNVAVGASGDDYDILAESVGDGRLFFAGEATTKRYPATMHGAFLTGLREAANMSHYASNRAMRTKVQRNTLKNTHSCACLLADLFREPDLEFGSFSVIHCKKISDPKSVAILRVTFGEPQKKNEGSRPDQQHSSSLLVQQLQSHFNQQQEFHVYTLLSRQQALELMDVRGGDEMRLNYLCENLGVKLIGRKGLGPSADSVIASIKAERGNRRSTTTSLTLKSGTSKFKPANPKQKMIRKAKILGNSNGSTISNKGPGVKIVDHGIDSSSSKFSSATLNKGPGLQMVEHGIDSSSTPNFSSNTSNIGSGLKMVDHVIDSSTSNVSSTTSYEGLGLRIVDHGIDSSTPNFPFTTSNKGLGLRIVDHGIDSSGPLSFPVGTKAISNGNNSTHPDSDNGAKEAIWITSGPIPEETRPFSIIPPPSSDTETVKYSGELQ